MKATEQENKAFKHLNINYKRHNGLLSFLACQKRPDLAPAVFILSSFKKKSLESGPSLMEVPEGNNWPQTHPLTWLFQWLQLNQIIQQCYMGWWSWDLKFAEKLICFWNSCPFAWNKKQKNISLSSTEAELNALLNGVQEIWWVTYLVEELCKEKLNPPELNVENQGLVENIKNFGSNSKIKHLEIEMKWLRELKDENWANIKLIPSENMVDDALTKPRNAEYLKQLQEWCFLFLFTPTWRGCWNYCCGLFHVWCWPSNHKSAAIK